LSTLISPSLVSPNIAPETEAVVAELEQRHSGTTTACGKRRGS
jgi:hypothetical protein